MTYILYFVTPEKTQGVDKDPWQRPAKINQLVHSERHDASSQNIILHPGIPCGPESLGNVEMGIVFGYIFKLAPVSARGQRGGIPTTVRTNSRVTRGTRGEKKGEGFRVHCVSQGPQLEADVMVGKEKLNSNAK